MQMPDLHGTPIVPLSGDREARLLSGLLLRELLRSAPEVFAGQAAASLPLAFLAKADEDKEVAQQWGEVWEEGTVSAAGALRLYMGEIVPLVLAGERGKHSISEAQSKRITDAASGLRM